MTLVNKGIGDHHPQLAVYIGNRPAMAPFASLQSVLPATEGSIKEIGQHCGNGWRKVFNVYAKLVFALGDPELTGESPTWQKYRDERLLRAESATALLFSPPIWTWQARGNGEKHSPDVHIIMGKHYGLSFDLPADMQWLDHEFAISYGYRCIICPYFDYRQLSNIKIIRLVELIKELAAESIGEDST